MIFHHTVCLIYHKTVIKAYKIKIKIMIKKLFLQMLMNGDCMLVMFRAINDM